MWLSFITTEITNPLAPRSFTVIVSLWHIQELLISSGLCLKRQCLKTVTCGWSLSVTFFDPFRPRVVVLFYSEPRLAMVERRRDWGVGKGKGLRSGFRPSSPRLHRSLRTRALDLLWPRSSLRASFPGVPVGTGVGKRTGPFSPCRLSAPGELVRGLT